MSCKRKFPFLFIVAIGFLCLTAVSARAERLVLPAGSAAVRFSPDGDVLEGIIASIDGAKSAIRMQLYIFNSEPIARALVRAKARGVDVEGVMDGEQAALARSKASLLAKAGVVLYLDSPEGGINHNKVFIIDGSLLVMGSYNMQDKSEKHSAENVLFIHSPELAGLYLKNYEQRRRTSKRLQMP